MGHKVFYQENMDMRLGILFLSILLGTSGCSETWRGLKKDSSYLWSETKRTTGDAVKNTKEVIHKATG